MRQGLPEESLEPLRQGIAASAIYAAPFPASVPVPSPSILATLKMPTRCNAKSPSRASIASASELRPVSARRTIPAAVPTREEKLCCCFGQDCFLQLPSSA